MSIAWVAHPGSEFPKDPNLLKSIEEKQQIFEAIDKKSYIECCRICGSVDNLSLEHTPSKAAFNKKSLLSLSPLNPIVSRFMQWKARKVQGGSKTKTLCNVCNNNTGSWYNPEYVKFAKICTPYANPENAHKAVNIRTSLFPARLIKQALTNICSVSQAGLCQEYGHLKAFIIERAKSAELSPLKIGLFISVNAMGRSSGITIFVDTDRNVARLIAEFSFWPLGWILTLDNLPYNGTLDITAWSSLEIDKREDLSLEIPCQWCISPYPGDFRPPEKVFSKVEFAS